MNPSAGDTGRNFNWDPIFTSYMLVVDEDVGNSPLASLLLKVVLDIGAVRRLVEPRFYDQLLKRIVKEKGAYSLVYIWDFRSGNSVARRFFAFRQYGQ